MRAIENFLKNKEKKASYTGTVNSFILTHFGSHLITEESVNATTTLFFVPQQRQEPSNRINLFLEVIGALITFF